MAAAKVAGYRVVASAAPGGPDPADLSAAFKLHSRPGAPFFILLDFDGHTLVGSVWNSWYGPFRQPAYSLDADEAFSDLERANIVQIWRGVAEDFAPWEVDVTTEDDGRALSGAGVRVVVGGTSCRLDGSPAGAERCKWGGVAYVGSFGDPGRQPVFAFSESLRGDPKFVTEAVSHEVGHSLGLGHDGRRPPPPGDNQTEYYRGHGRWAPIMGVGYRREVTQWSRGEYSKSTNRQDDLSVIRRRLTPRPDDHGGGAGGATPLVLAAVSGAAAGRVVGYAYGNIETTGDQDWFSFDAGAGPARLSLGLAPFASSPANASLGYARANLDLKLSVRGPGSAGPALASWDPQGSLLDGVFEFELRAAGRYWLALAGAGDGGPEEGYSSYASLGEYSLALDAPAPGGAGGGGDGGLRVKLVEYVGETNAKGWARVARAQLLVTDASGAPFPGARVSAQWVNVFAGGAPGGGRPPRPFGPKTATAKASRGTKSKPAGSVTLSSPYAPAPGIYLRILSVEPPRGGGASVALDRAGSDDFVEFSW